MITKQETNTKLACRCVSKLLSTHSVDELAHHAGPAAVGLRGAVQPVVHQLDPEGELQDVGQLPQHVHAEPLVLVVTAIVLVVGLAHHVRVFLSEGK